MAKRENSLLALTKRINSFMIKPYGGDETWNLK
nr:MAG TPA: hypothetical protein [Caudoviricetes sp.]